jgi:hypothetical protein
MNKTRWRKWWSVGGIFLFTILSKVAHNFAGGIRFAPEELELGHGRMSLTSIRLFIKNQETRELAGSG